MNGIQYLTDKNGNRVAVQLDLKLYEKEIAEFLEDLQDIQTINDRKDDPSLLYEDVRKKLKVKGKL